MEQRLTHGYTPLIVFAIAVILAGVLLLRHQRQSVPTASQVATARCTGIRHAFQARRSNIWLTASGRVGKILPDSYGQFDHQRFILRCRGGMTVLIVNDVSVGQRVPVSFGTPVGVRGEYIWNPDGGLLHFTHHGVGGLSGWILLKGHVYS